MWFLEVWTSLNKKRSYNLEIKNFGERRWRRWSNFVAPNIIALLQIENPHHALHDTFLFRNENKKRSYTLEIKSFGERRWRRWSNFVAPNIIALLQIENPHHALHDTFLFRNENKKLSYTLEIKSFGERRWRRWSNFVAPNIIALLQIENPHHALHDTFLFRKNIQSFALHSS